MFTVQDAQGIYQFALLRDAIETVQLDSTPATISANGHRVIAHFDGAQWDVKAQDYLAEFPSYLNFKGNDPHPGTNYPYSPEDEF